MFVLQVNNFLSLNRTLTKTTNFCVRNSKGLCEASINKIRLNCERQYVILGKILARVSRYFTLCIKFSEGKFKNEHSNTFFGNVQFSKLNTKRFNGCLLVVSGKRN